MNPGILFILIFIVSSLLSCMHSISIWHWENRTYSMKQEKRPNNIYLIVWKRVCHLIYPLNSFKGKVKAVTHVFDEWNAQLYMLN